MRASTAAAVPAASAEGSVTVGFRGGERYELTVRGHHVPVDQPTDAGGEDTAPTPTELFVASLAGCVAYVAGRYLTRHGITRDGLSVEATFAMAADRPSRVAMIQVVVHPPADLPPERTRALTAVVNHCTVHKSLTTPPDVTITVT